MVDDVDARWNPQPGDGLPWWLEEDLSAGHAAVFVRCFAAITAVLADELELPPGTLPLLLHAALVDSADPDGSVGREPFMRSLCAAVREALG
jgi:hypothetical protein